MEVGLQLLDYDLDEICIDGLTGLCKAFMKCGRLIVVGKLVICCGEFQLPLLLV